MTITVKEMMDVTTNKTQFEAVTERCESNLSANFLYVQRLDLEVKTMVKTRQIEERKAFNWDKLSIKLLKFKGYKRIDFYTFKSNFEKLYLKSTSAELRPDLLKNNFLDNPVLLLVKDVGNIEDI